MAKWARLPLMAQIFNYTCAKHSKIQLFRHLRGLFLHRQQSKPWTACITRARRALATRSAIRPPVSPCNTAPKLSVTLPFCGDHQHIVVLHLHLDVARLQPRHVDDEDMGIGILFDVGRRHNQCAGKWRLYAPNRQHLSSLTAPFFRAVSTGFSTTCMLALQPMRRTPTLAQCFQEWVFHPQHSSYGSHSLPLC